MVERFIKLI